MPKWWSYTVGLLLLPVSFSSPLPYSPISQPRKAKQSLALIFFNLLHSGFIVATTFSSASIFFHFPFNFPFINTHLLLSSQKPISHLSIDLVWIQIVTPLQISYCFSLTHNPYFISTHSKSHIFFPPAHSPGSIALQPFSLSKNGGSFLSHLNWSFFLICVFHDWIKYRQTQTQTHFMANTRQSWLNRLFSLVWIKYCLKCLWVCVCGQRNDTSWNNNFHILNKIIHFFTHTYFKKLQKTLNNDSQTTLPNIPQRLFSIFITQTQFFEYWVMENELRNWSKHNKFMRGPQNLENELWKLKIGWWNT